MVASDWLIKLSIVVAIHWEEKRRMRKEDEGRGGSREEGGEGRRKRGEKLRG